MLKVKRVLLLLMVIVIVLAVMAFVLENQHAITLSFLGLSTAQLPVSIFVVLALITGMLIGPVFTLLTRRHDRRKQAAAGP